MIPDNYRSIPRPSKAVFKDRNSKFFAFAFPVSSLEEIRTNIEELKKEYYDATHHCYAYILGPEKEITKAHDDGEPSHSAGDPILGQIRSKELSDTLVVVVRYFGGTKLGVGGLIQAYRTAASLALEENQIITKRVYHTIKIRFPYPKMNQVMKMIQELDLKIFNQTFEEICDMELGTPPSMAHQTQSRFKNAQIQILADFNTGGN